MLCQQCQVKEATVHFSTVAWPLGQDTTHLCETCYPKAESERTASYGPKPRPLPIIDVEGITASEYLAFAANAHANSVDAPVYRHVSKELERFSATRERIGIEMLTMAWQSIEEGNEGWNLIGLGSCFVKSVPTANTQRVVQLLEKIILRSVELMAQSPDPPSSHPFGFGLTLAGNALRRTDPEGSRRLFQSLRTQHPESAPVHAVLDYLDKHMAESEQACGKKPGSDV